MTLVVTVREERPEDVAAIRLIVHRAFGQTEEADLVEQLRRADAATVSLVALGPAPADAPAPDAILGHILFSPVTIDGGSLTPAVGLAPMAVAPAHQRQGVGTALIEAGLALCRAHGIGIVVVLGHPDYYPRFGFQPAHKVGLACEYDVPADVFMAMELAPGALDSASGVVRYHAAFSQL